MLHQENILFNTLKHHAGFIRVWISHTNPFSLLNELRIVGKCQVDIYYGELTVQSIYQEILNRLNVEGVFNCDQYKSLIDSYQGYYTLTLSDGSAWVLRLGRNERAFIHIHPGRNSPLIMRVAANALKSTLAMGVFIRSREIESVDLDLFNKVRTSVNLSPVKSLREMKDVERVMLNILPKFSNHLQHESLAVK